jgi:hypothetical protein
MKQVKTPVGEDHAFSAPLQVRHNLIRPLQGQYFLNTHSEFQPLPKEMSRLKQRVSIEYSNTQGTGTS